MAVAIAGTNLKKMTFDGQTVKKWVHEGTTVFSAEYDAVADGGWTQDKDYYGNISISQTAVNVNAANNGGSYARAYKVVNLTEYTKMTITLNAYAVYSYFSVGVAKALPSNLSYSIDVGVMAKDIGANGQTLTANGTYTFDISGLSGDYYVYIGAYSGNGSNTYANVSKFIFE